ncbi:hypothetical protein PVAG01_00325 [Phlyctema vagabunda]|uniref:Aminoglycoside phosphotransferase domain-containing protein n=1 Tax=Phlyctema vagabunda TaxID=108571 RepID=A0ABR4PVB8_9HELO
MGDTSEYELSDVRVQQTLSLIYSAPFTPTEHRLLSSFVSDPVSPKSTSAYLLDRICKDGGSEQHDKWELQLLLDDWKSLVERFRRASPNFYQSNSPVFKRDGGVCGVTGRSRLWWDVLGWSQTIVTPVVPDGIVDLFGSSEFSHLVELLSVFLTEKQVEKLRVMVSAKPSNYNICRRSLTLSRYAAAAFKEGRIQLEPDWNIERCPNEDLKAMCRYSLWAAIPMLMPLPTTKHGDTLRSGSVIEMETRDLESAPLPSVFLLGIQCRFCSSLKSLEVDCHMMSIKSLKSGTQWLSKLRQVCSARAFLCARSLWSYFPRQGRIAVYRLLLSVGTSLYEKPNFWTQRVPFGLYIKHGRTKLIPKGEAPALQLVEHFTDIPAPRLLEHLDDGSYTYLVMTRLPGQPLMQELYTMTYPERTALATDLRKCVQQLKKIPNTNKSTICDANGGPVFDYRLPGRLGGPFETEVEFNDFIITQDRLRDPCHARSHSICFTHADLNPNNILIKAGKLSGIVDFGCAGYYPEYWEYTKAMFSTPGLDSSFARLFEEIFGEVHRDELEAE